MNEEYKTRIPELMRRRGWTKQELGRRMGITEAGVTHLISGDGVPLAMLERAARAFELPVWEMLASRREVITACSGQRIDMLCPVCGKRIGLHVGVSCEALHPSRRYDN